MKKLEFTTFKKQQMRVSRFTKTLSVAGSHGVITGTIEVTMNYASTTIKGTHAVTHDDYVKPMSVHKIEGYIGDKIHWKQADLNDENRVLNEVERCEKQLLADMHDMANKEPVKTFADKMKDLGF